jgi:hypothetical protein
LQSPRHEEWGSRQQFEHNLDAAKLNAIVAAIGLSKQCAPPATHEIISFVAPINRPAGERDFARMVRS